MEKTDNEIIAEFMGYTIGRLSGWMSGTHETPYSYKKKDGNILNPVRIDKLKYQTSWDWLMPVVEKIRVWLLDAKSNTTNPMLDEMEMYENIADGLWWTNKDATHKAVIDFIKWYTTQPKQNRLALQSKDEELKQLKNDLLDALDLKEGNGPTALSMLKSANDSLQEQLKAKEEYIQGLTEHRDSLTSEKERLRAYVQSIRDSVEVAGEIKIQALPAFFTKIDTLLSQSTDKP